VVAWLEPLLLELTRLLVLDWLLVCFCVEVPVVLDVLPEVVPWLVA
jgi:hypothetical protein